MEERELSSVPQFSAYSASPRETRSFAGAPGRADTHPHL
jgi:hypothetical protein